MKYLNSVNGAGSTWNCLTTINTCNGVIEKSLLVDDMSMERRKTVVAEARFLRALFYFELLQTYGAVPLDLGSGRLAFNTHGTALSERNSVSEVYEAILTDLHDALDNLPDKAIQDGRASKPAALHFLAKVYLTRASNSEAKQTTDYARAFEYAERLLDNLHLYDKQLLKDFAQVFAEGNEDSRENLFNMQSTHDYTFGKGNYLCFYFTPGI